MFALLTSAFAAEPCAAGWAEAHTAVDAAEAAWGVDEAAFQAAAATLQKTVPCLVEPLAPQQAAAIHRIQGLSAWLGGDTDAARRDFAAARAADRAWTFPVAMVPEGNPVRALYEGAPALPGGTPLPPPRGAALRLDGVPSRLRPEDRPVVFQLTKGERAVHTEWLPPGAPTPTYAVAGAGLRGPLLIGTGAAALGAGALSVLAWRMYEEPPVPTSEADLDAFVAQNHAAAIGAGGLGVAAVGLGVTAMVVGRW